MEGEKPSSKVKEILKMTLQDINYYNNLFGNNVFRYVKF